MENPYAFLRDFRTWGVGAAVIAGAMTGPYWYSYTGAAGIGGPEFRIPVGGEFTVEQTLWALAPGLAVLIVLPGALALALASADARKGSEAIVTRRLAYACLVSAIVAAIVVIALMADHPDFDYPYATADQKGTVGVRFPPWVALGCLAFSLAWVWRMLNPAGSYQRQLMRLFESTRVAEPKIPRAPTRKRCPDCAETVQAEARVCKHCGYRFSPPGSEESPSP